MTDLRVGNRVPIFVTHVEFENAGCQAFVHVGDLGSQADTVIERTDEFVNSGAAEVPATCSVGDLCLALFHEDNGWYRAQVLSVAGQSFTVFFIDYGNTETVKIDDLRSASEYVLAIPALSTKCHISDCIPLNEQSWTEEETKKISSMLHSQEFIAEVVSVNSSVQITTCTVKLFKTDEPNVPVFLRKSSSSSDLTVKLEELQVGQEYTVFISYVESSRKFWVQLKQKEGELNSLMSDIGACFAEDLPSSGDILNPTLHQICASCFSEDGSFYRAKVQSLNGDMCKVFFVDYGNSENKSASELFTLPQVLCELPMQAIECSYTSKSDIVTVEDTLHKLEADGTPCVVKVVSKFSSGYIVEIDVVEKLVNVNQSHTQSKMVKGKSDGKLWTSVPSVVLQVGGVYDVCLSHVEHPGRFFVQLIGNASKLDDVMQSIDEIAHNLEGLIISNPGTLCIAKFSDDAWYRSEILSVDNGRLTLGAIDFGFIEHFSSKHLLRKIDPKFKELPAQSVMCTLDSARLNNSDWSSKEKDKFCALIDKTALVCRVTAKSGGIFQVDLFDTTNSQEKHINKELIPSPSTSVSQSVQSRPFQNARPQLKLPPPETKLGSQITLCITAVKSKLVFGQVTHTPVEKVAKLQTDLNDYFEKKSTEMLDNVDVGSVCCTQYSDGGWYRGIVTALEGSQVEVSFADFGDSSLKAKSDLKSLVPSFCELPQQCILVSFENLPPVAGNKLESVLVNKRIDVRLKSKGDGVYPQYSGELLSQSVLDELQGKPTSGFGAKFGQPRDRENGPQKSGFGGNRDGGFSRRREDGSGNPGFAARTEGSGGRRDRGGFGEGKAGGFGANKDQSGFSGQRDEKGLGERKGGFSVNRDGGGGGGFGKRDGGFGSRGAEESQGRGTRGPHTPSGDTSGFTKQVVNVGSTLGVMVTYVRDPGHFQVVLEDMSNSLDVMMDQLHEHYDKLPPNSEQLENPHLGQPCVAQYSEDKGWYRAIVSGLLSNGLSEVMFVDYGNNECTPRETLKIIKDEFKILPAQAILCSLAGVSPSQGFWSPEHTVQFEEMVVEQSFMGTFKSQSREPGQEVVYKVELVDKKKGSINQKFASNTGTRCIESEQGHSSRTVSSAGSGMNITVTSGDDWDESGDNSTEQGFGQGRKFGDDRGGGGFSGNQEERGFRDRNERGSGDHRSGSGRNREGGFNRDHGRESGFQRRQNGEGGGFGERSGGFNKSGFGSGDSGGDRQNGEGGGFRGRSGGFNKEGGFGSRGSGDRRGGFRQSGGRDSESRGGGGFGQHNDRDGSSRGGGFGQKTGGSFGQSGDKESGPRDSGFRQGSGGGFGKSADRDGRGGGFGWRSREEQGGSGGRKGFDRGEAGDAGFGDRGGFGGNKGGFGVRGGSGDNRGGFAGNQGGFSGGGSNEATEDDWDADTVAVPVTLLAKPVPAQTSPMVKRFRGVNSVEEETADDVFMNLNLNVRESVDVYVVYTVNPDLFYCQLIKNCNSLSELMTQMNTYYEGLAEGEMSLEKPEIGMPCAAKFSEDDAWYRAEVQTPGQMEVEVHFVDYGNIENIAVSKIRKLKPEFLKMKSQGIKCGLDGVVAQNKVWSEKAIEDFEDLTMDKHLVAKIINRSSDGTHILELENIEEKVNIGDSMCEKGHCSYASSKISPKKEQVIENPYPAVQLPLGSEIDVYVSCIENPEQFWIQPVNDEEKLVQFVDGVQELYTSGAGASMNVTAVMPGQAVMALFSEDSAWYRGYVEKKSPKDAKVRFVDYGNSDIVPRESLRQPTEEMIKEGSHATLCRLKGVRPLQTGVWTPDAKDIMNSLVTDVVKCKIIEADGKEYTVQLTAGGTDVAEELIRAAVVRAEKEPSPPPVESLGPPKKDRAKTLFFQSQIKVSIGSTEPVYVTQTDSVASFWCQLVKYYPQLDEVMGKLETFCKSGSAPADFSVNMACGAKFSGDQSWYRAKVTAVYPDSVEVLFVDYGNCEKVLKSDIRHLSEDLIDLPTQAIHCTLENSSVSTNQLTKKFLELTSDVEVNMTVVEDQEDITVVRLALANGNSVAEQLGLVQGKQVTATVTDDSKEKAPSPAFKKYPEVARPASAVQVYISQISSPSSFYVQLVEQEVELNELMEKVAATYQDETKYKVTSVSEGQSCCSKFLEDGAWYRAFVVKRMGMDALVRFVDYGNSQRTTMDGIRNITDELVRQAPFAYGCKFGNISPVDSLDKWPANAVENFETLVLDKEIECHFIKDSEAKLIVNGEDIAEKLVQLGVAKSLSVEAKQEPVNVTFKNYKIPDPALPTESVTCFVSHVRSNDMLYLQLAHEEEKLIALTESLQEKAVSLQTVPFSALKTGDFCIAKFSEDQSWYRAVVETVSDSSATVQFIDYGNSDKIEVGEDLKCPTEELAEEHPYAYQCKLHAVLKPGDLDADKLLEVTREQELTCMFHSLKVPYEVELHNENGENILDMLKTKVLEEIVTTTNKALEPEQSDGETETPGKEEQETADSGVDVDKVINDVKELKSEMLENEQRARVTVSHVDSPCDFWVQLVSKKGLLDELLNYMFDFYTASEDDRIKIESVEEDMVVAALFSEDESWYRAKVLKVDGEGIVVHFLDHGNQETVSMDSLRKLPAEFGEFPMQAIRCSLAGVVPKDGGEWSTEVSEVFSEILLEKELILDVCGVQEGGIYQVQLLDMGVPVTEILLQKGVGVELATPIPVSTKTKQVFSPESKEEIMARLFAPKASNKVSKYGYKMRQFEVLEPTIGHPAVVQVINSPTDFWCQMSDNSYDYLQEKLLESYKDTGNCDKLQEVAVGSRCVVKFDDNEFFRGSIVEVDSETDKVTVLCVDNGIQHKVARSDVLQYKLEFDKFPQLAFPCALDIKAPKTESIWDKEVCDKFKEIVLELGEVEQLPAYGKVTINRLEEDKVIVKLTIDRLSIADHLVQIDMADICDSLKELEIKDQKASQKLFEFGSFVNIQLPVDSEHEVLLIDCDNLDRLVFHTLEDHTVLEEMSQKIMEFAKNHEPSEDSWSPGQSCLVKCPEDDLWYRANIVSELEEKLQVFLVDYGSYYTLPSTSLLPLPEDLSEIKAQAVICKLAEIEPAEEDWSEEAVDFFTEHYFHDKPTPLCLYVTNYEGGVHEVTVSQGSEEKTANMIMAEIGYAVPVLGSALQMELLTDQAETSFLELSLAKEDSFDSELGESPYEGKTTNITTDASNLELDTSCLDTETSHLESDTSQTEIDSSPIDIDQSQLSHDISADGSGLKTDLSQVDISRSQLQTERSYLEPDMTDESDLSHLETDTSQVETDMSHHETESSFQETDTSATEVESSFLHTDTSCLDTTDTSCIVTDTDTTDTSCIVTDTDATDTSVTQTDVSVLQAPKNKKDYQNTIEEESVTIKKDNGKIKVPESKMDDNSNIITSSNHISPRPVEEVGLERSNLENAENSLDESWLNFSYGPTGYTTSELDTTDMTGLESTIDSSGVEISADMNDLETTSESFSTIDKTGFTELEMSSNTCHKSDTETADEGGDSDVGIHFTGNSVSETKVVDSEIESSKQEIALLVDNEKNIEGELEQETDHKTEEKIENGKERENEQVHSQELHTEVESVFERGSDDKAEKDIEDKCFMKHAHVPAIETEKDSVFEGKKYVDSEAGKGLELHKYSGTEREIIKEQKEADIDLENNIGNKMGQTATLEKETEEKPLLSDVKDYPGIKNQQILEAEEPTFEDEEEIFQSDNETSEHVDSSLTNVTAMTHPSFSDTTFHSTSEGNILMNELGERLFRSVTKCRTDSIGTCENCGSDLSSFLDTTGCSSEFSFYVCYDCQQKKDEIDPDISSQQVHNEDVEEKLGEVFELAAGLEQNQDENTSNLVVEEEELKQKADESDQDERTLLDRRKEEQAVFGHYSAIILKPLSIDSEKKEFEDKIVDECQTTSRVTKILHLCDSTLEDKHEICPENEQGENENDSKTETEPRELDGAELQGAVGGSLANKYVDNAEPVSILEEVSLLLSEIQDKVFVIGMKEDICPGQKVREKSMLDIFSKLSIENEATTMENSEKKPTASGESDILGPPNIILRDGFKIGDVVQKCTATDMPNEPSPEIDILEGDNSLSCTETVLEREDQKQLVQDENNAEDVDKGMTTDEHKEEKEELTDKLANAEETADIQEGVYKEDKGAPSDTTTEEMEGKREPEEDSENKQEVVKESNEAASELDIAHEETVKESDTDQGTTNTTEQNGAVEMETNAAHIDHLKQKDQMIENTLSDDSDTETFEDADVSVGEIGVGSDKKITSDKESAEDSEAFYDVE